MRKLPLRVLILFVAAAPVLGAPLGLTVGDQTVVGVQMGVGLANMPNYEWWYGCSPTSTGMMMGFYDRNGYNGVSYANLVPGAVAELTTFPASGGPYAVNGIIASQGHVSDFYVGPYGAIGDDVAQPWHSFDSLADFMGTSQDAAGNFNGSTMFYWWPNGMPFTESDAKQFLASVDLSGMYGTGEYVSYADPLYDACVLYNQPILNSSLLNNTQFGFTFADYMNEIDAGRPVLIHVSTPDVGGHTMAGYGYTLPNTVLLYDTWADADGPGPWTDGQNPGTMTWGGSYSRMDHLGVTVFVPCQVPEPATMTLLGLGSLSLLAARRRRRRRAA